MKICEIFHAIQGEGINIGKPSIFIRFFGCNLACTWCDTPYSWQKDAADFETMDLNTIITKVESFPCSHIIFTGGEPTLFQDNIKTITDTLGENYTFELETNGSMPIKHDLWQTINISPKLANSGNHPYL